MSVGVLLVRMRVGSVDGGPGGDVLADAPAHGAEVIACPAAAAAMRVIGPVELVGRASVGTGAAVT